MNTRPATASVDHVCGACRHCEHDRHVLEAAIPGLISFGSGFGASVGETRLCRRHDRLISPNDSCGEFEPCRGGALVE
jgi:hypothetical protein